MREIDRIKEDFEKLKGYVQTQEVEVAGLKEQLEK